jgi:hypothetical protein
MAPPSSTVAGSGVGVSVAGLDGHGELFGEAAGRVLASVEADRAAAVEGRCREAGVPVFDLGVTGGDRLVVDDLVDLDSRRPSPSPGAGPSPPPSPPPPSRADRPRSPPVAPARAPALS